MASIYYVKDGPRPDNSGAGVILENNKVISAFGGYPLRYLGKTPPEFNVDKYNSNIISAARHVVVEIVDNKLSPPFNEAGYYLVKGLSPDDASKILKA